MGNVRRHSSKKRSLFQGHEQIKEETVYRYDTIIGEVNGDVTVRDINSLTIIIDNVPQLRELLMQYPDESSFRVINRRRQVIRTESNKSEDVEDSGKVVEDTVVPDSGDIVDRSEIIQALDDEGTNTLARVENINEYVSPEDGMNHITFDLKIVKSTLIGPMCRFNKVVILIVMFLSLATAIFILFFIYVLNGQ